MEPIIDFGLVDEKEQVVSINSNKAINKHNALLMTEIKAEYTIKLEALQERLKEKYEPQLIDNSLIKGESEDEINKVHYKKLAELLQ